MGGLFSSPVKEDPIIKRQNELKLVITGPDDDFYFNYSIDISCYYFEKESNGDKTVKSVSGCRMPAGIRHVFFIDDLMSELKTDINKHLEKYPLPVNVDITLEIANPASKHEKMFIAKIRKDKISPEIMYQEIAPELNEFANRIKEHIAPQEPSYSDYMNDLANQQSGCRKSIT